MAGSDDPLVDNVRSILDGVLSFLFGQVGRKVIGLATTVLLTRLLTVDGFGLLTFGLIVVGIGTKFSGLGATKTLVKLLPKYSDQREKQRRVLTVAGATVAVGILLFGGIFYLSVGLINDLSFQDPMLPVLLRILVWVMAFEVLLNVSISAFGGLKRIRLKRIINDGIKPICRSGSIVIALYLGASVVGIATALAAGFAVGAFVGLFLVSTVGGIPPTRGVTRGDVDEFLEFSIPLTIQDSGSVLYKQIDLLMVGFLLTASDVGLLKVAMTATAYLSFPLQAFNQLFGPLSSELYERGNYRRLETIFESVSRWALTAVLPVAAGILVYWEQIFSVFGSEYVQSPALLAVLVVQGIALNITGPSGQLLVMTNNQYYQAVNQWVFGVMNVILNVVLILQLGVLGAAIATVTTTTLANVARAGEIWYLEDLSPVGVATVKPLAAIVPASGIMWFVSTQYTGLVSIAAGIGAGGVVYLFGLFVFGIESIDRELVAQLLFDQRVE